MRSPRFWILSLALAFLVPAGIARGEGPLSARARMLALGGGQVRFRMLQDQAAGALTLRLVDGGQLLRPPVFVVGDPATEVAFLAVDGQPGVFRLIHPRFRGTTLDGTLRVFWNGQILASPLSAATTIEEPIEVPPELKMIHGGRLVSFDDCLVRFELVQDYDKGTITLYPLSGPMLDQPPRVVITEDSLVTTVNLEKSILPPMVWRVSSNAFRSRTAWARLRILIDGRACEASLSVPPHGGHIVVVPDGPQIEVVKTDKGEVRAYVLETRMGDTPLAISDPEVVITTPDGGEKAFALGPISGEPRAFAYADFKVPTVAKAQAKLRFKLNGRVVETDIGRYLLGPAGEPPVGPSSIPPADAPTTPNNPPGPANPNNPNPRNPPNDPNENPNPVK